MAMVKPPRVMVLRVPPKAEMTRTPATSERGMARAEIKVARRLPRKRKSTISTRKAPSRSAIDTLRTATEMKSACRKFWVSIFTPAGNAFARSASTRSVSRVSSRVLAPGCFWTLKTTAGRATVRRGAPSGRRGLAHARDLAHLQGDSALDPQHGGREVGGGEGAAPAAHQVLLSRIHVEAGGGHAARLLEGRHDLLDREPRLDHRRGVELDQVLAHVAADGHHLRDPGDGQQVAAHHRLRQPPQLEGSTVSEVRAMNVISPMIELMGPRVGRSTPRGRDATWTFSVTTWRAR